MDEYADAIAGPPEDRRRPRPKLSARTVATGAVWVALIASGVTVLALPSIAIWFSPSPGEAASEILKVAFGWPFLILAVGILIAVALRSDAGGLFGAIPIRLLFGKTEEPELRLPDPSPDGKNTLPAGPSFLAIGTPQFGDALFVEGSPDDAREYAALQRACREYVDTARHWRNMYLSTFPLVRDTLHWFGKRQTPVQELAFHRTWRRRLPDSIHRQYLLATLIDYQLLDKTDNALGITAAGREFLAFTGQHSGRSANYREAQGMPGANSARS